MSRLISRVITGIYDEKLRPFGIGSVQLALLVVIQQIERLRERQAWPSQTGEHKAKFPGRGIVKSANQLLGNSLSVALSKCLSASRAFARCPTSSPESL
jgi:hypothetical protein